MTARVDRSWLKGIGKNKSVMVETRRSRDAVKPAAWNVAHLDNSGAKRGRFPVAEKSRRTVDSIVFDSKAEATRYSQLRLLERAGRVSDIEVQPSWDVMIEGQKLCTFSADFSYYCHERARPVIEDVKSDGTQKDTAYRLRKRAAELSFGIRVEEVVI